MKAAFLPTLSMQVTPVPGERDRDDDPRQSAAAADIDEALGPFDAAAPAQSGSSGEAIEDVLVDHAARVADRR